MIQIKPSAFKVLLFSYCLLVQTTHGFLFEGSRIIDLEGDGLDFIADAVSWVSMKDGKIAKIQNNQLYSMCDGTYHLGGHGILGYDFVTLAKQYTNLPPHEIIHFSIYVSLIDEWKSTSAFAIIFDHQSFLIGAFTLDSSVHFLENKCGNPNINDLKQLRVYGKAKHQDQSLFLKIGVVSSDPKASLGFREVVLLFRNQTEEEKASDNQICGLASISLPLRECECLEGQYKDFNGVCQLCDSTCKTCFGLSPSDCLQCTDQAFFDGNECKMCHASCATCFGASDSQCSSCPSDYYVFEQSSCISACNFPLIPTTVGTVKYCSFPCSSDEFLYPNGECKNACSYTYNLIVSDNRKFCSHFCPNGEYYVPNRSGSAETQTCLENCPHGYYVDNLARYCIPCQDSFCTSCPTENGTKCEECQVGAILDLDGVCKECQSIIIKYKKMLKNGHQYYFETLPKTCAIDPIVIQQGLSIYPHNRSNLISFPFSVVSRIANQYVLDLILTESTVEETKLEVNLHHLTGFLALPKKIVPSTQLQELAEYASPTQKALNTILSVGLGGAIILGSTTTIWSIIGFQQFVGYLQYINIDYPFQIEIFFSLLGSSTWDFLPNPLDSVTNPLFEILYGDPSIEQIKKPPQKFYEKEISSSFIKNGGGIMVLNILLLVLLCLVSLMRRLQLFKKMRLLKILLKALKWNVIARTYLENGIPLMLAVFLQLRSSGFDSTYLILCFIFATPTLIYIIVVFVLFVKILHQKTVDDLKKNFSKQIYGTLWEGISLKDPLSKYYHVIIFLRGCLLVSLVVFFEDFPLLQIVPLIFYNAGLVLYLFKEADFEDRYLNIINRIKEVLILIGEMLILGLTFRNGSEEHYNNLGWLVVICFLSSLAIETIYMITKQIMSVKEAVKKIQTLWVSVRSYFRREVSSGLKRSYARKDSEEKLEKNSMMMMEMGDISKDEAEFALQK